MLPMLTSMLLVLPCCCTGAQSTKVPARSAEYTKPTNSYQIDCPSGSFVTGFTVTQDSSIALDADGEQNDILVTSLWPLKCSNGKSADIETKLQKLSKSRSSNNKRAAGYTGITLYTGELVDAVSLQPAGTKFGGSGGGNTRVVACPTGQVISGIYGQASETHVISVGLSCSAKK